MTSVKIEMQGGKLLNYSENVAWERTRGFQNAEHLCSEIRNGSESETMSTFYKSGS